MMVSCHFLSNVERIWPILNYASEIVYVMSMSDRNNKILKISGVSAQKPLTWLDNMLCLLPS